MRRTIDITQIGVVLLVCLALRAPADAADGSLDPRFGSGGIVVNDFGVPSAVVLQPDGKIVVVGSRVARYNVDGSLDLTFGGSGTVRTEVGASYQLNAVAVQDDGKILVAGGSGGAFFLLRYNANGSLDKTFGARGIVRTEFDTGEDVAHGIALQPDGKIVVAGTDNFNIELARYSRRGALDKTFGTGGKIITDTGRTESALAVAIQSDGRIVVAGAGFGPTSGRSEFLVGRYNVDGTLDHFFGNGGLVYTDFSGRIDVAQAVLIQSDGKIVAGGYAGSSRSALIPFDFAMARYNDDGTLDATFGQGGRVVTALGFEVNSRINGLALQIDGKIVAAGVMSVATSPGGSIDIAVAQYNDTGILDPVFGVGGITLTDLGGFEAAIAVAVQSDGKIVALARDDRHFILTRYVYESARGAFGGVARVIPGRIEAEDYDLGGEGIGYVDTTPGDEGGFVYRTDDVDIKASREDGFAIGWFAAGEWLEYTVEVRETGAYSIAARVGSALSDRTFHIEVDGRDVTGAIPVPQTPDWDRYVTVRISGVLLEGGRRRVRVVMGPLDFMDLQWLEFSFHAGRTTPAR